MATPTREQIATDRNLWNDYVDPGNNEPAAFDNLSTAEKVAVQQEMFGDREE